MKSSENMQNGESRLRKVDLIESMLEINPDIAFLDVYIKLEKEYKIVIDYVYFMRVKKGFNQRQTLKRFKLL